MTTATRTKAPSASPGLPPAKALARAADVLKCAGEPTRLGILHLLRDGPLNVTNICKGLGGLSQPAVSHHLAILRTCGLVRADRNGKFHVYSLEDLGRAMVGMSEEAAS